MNINYSFALGFRSGMDNSGCNITVFTEDDVTVVQATAEKMTDFMLFLDTIIGQMQVIKDRTQPMPECPNCTTVLKSEGRWLICNKCDWKNLIQPGNEQRECFQKKE